MLFAAFIFFCGLTHIVSIYNIWHGAYGLHGIVKGFTALVSVMTAILLYKVYPVIIAIPTHDQLEAAITNANHEKIKRNKIELDRKSEAIFKFAIELVPAGVLVVDPNCEIRLANNSLEKIFGYEHDEMIGLRLSKLIEDNKSSEHDVLVKGYMNHPEQKHAMAAGRIVKGKNKKGEEVFVEVSLSAHEFEGDEHTFATVVDVSRVANEQTLFYEMSSRISRAIEASNEGVWEWNIKDGHMWFSKHMIEILDFGKDAGDLSYQDWLDIVYKEDRKHMEKVFDKHFETKNKFDVVCRCKTKAGKYEWFHSRGNTLFDDDGEPILMSGVMSNIEELKRLEYELGEREQTIKSLALDFMTTFEQAAVGIAHVALDGKWLRANKKLCDILGYELNRLLSLTFQDITFPEDLEEDLNCVKDLIDGRSNQYDMEKRYIKPDGTIIWAHLTVTIVRDEAGVNSHFISVIEDISKRKSIEKALEESNAALESFAYSTSHDLQEPLRKISSFATSLNKRLENEIDSPEGRFELSRISDAANRMREMINSLLQLSRYSSQAIEKQSVMASTLIGSAWDVMSDSDEKVNAKLILQSDIEIYVNLTAFKQVLCNVLVNSVRYKKPGGEPCIEIICESSNGMDRIIVKDSGIGFNSENNKVIFEPFRRLVGKDRPGSGMGLAICHRIVSAHGGTISATSEPSIGTKIIIEIPSKVED